MAGGIDLDTEYRAYLARFEQAAGKVDVGAYVKNGSRLVKKMTIEEFTPKWQAFTAAKRAYARTLERNDTINDLVIKTLREGAAELFADPEL